LFVYLFVYSFIHCSKQQRCQQNEELPTGQTSSGTTSNSTQPSQPDVVYGDIEQSQEPGFRSHQYVNAAATNNREANNDAVLYSELQSKDNDAHTVALSGDLYSQVQMR